MPVGEGHSGIIMKLKLKCKINPVLSRVCELGTKSCGVYHKELKKPHEAKKNGTKQNRYR